MREGERDVWQVFFSRRDGYRALRFRGISLSRRGGRTRFFFEVLLGEKGSFYIRNVWKDEGSCRF